MKSKFYLILAACCAFLAVSPDCVAENYFREGMKWEYKAYPDFFPDKEYKPYYVTQYLDGKDFVAGKHCLKLFTIVNDEIEHEPYLHTYISSVGDKVYFLSMKPGDDPETGEWLMLYDFGLKAGEVANIAFLFSCDAETLHKSVPMTCETITPESTHSHLLFKMSMTESQGDSKYFGDWIAGIGSLWGVACNGGWGFDGGGSMVLLRASLNGEVLYENVNAGIEGAEVDAVTADSDADCYKPDGTPFLPGDKGLCISNGKKRIVR